MVRYAQQADLQVPSSPQDFHAQKTVDKLHKLIMLIKIIGVKENMHRSIKKM